MENYFHVPKNFSRRAKTQCKKIIGGPSTPLNSLCPWEREFPHSFTALRQRHHGLPYDVKLELRSVIVSCA